MEMLQQLGVFTVEVVLIVVAIVVILGFIFAQLARTQKSKGNFSVESLNERYDDMKEILQAEILEKKDLKNLSKQEKKKLKQQAKQKKDRKKIYVLNFEGDVKASQVENLRQEVTAVLTMVTPADEVVVKVESPGGVVHGYGLAASQLKRFRALNVPLTICVDKVAASGGYMMACVGNQILAAPFAIVGSVGVVAQVPNLNKLLRKHDVDYKEYTAGEYKRTVSFLGEITPQGEQKFKQQLEETHVLFKNFVSGNRPSVDIHKVATGEYWYGEQALALGLVDKLMTSDDYLMSQKDNADIFAVTFNMKKSLGDKLSDVMGQSLEKWFLRIYQNFEMRRWG